MRKVLIALALLAAAPAAWAQDAAPATAVRAAPDADRLAAARSLMESMDAKAQIDRSMGPVMDQTMAKMVDTVITSNPGLKHKFATDPALEPKFRKVMAAMAKEMGQLMRDIGPNMVDEMAVMHARVFTLDELRGFRRFYASPEGQAYTRKTPQLMQEMATLMTDTMMPAMMERLPVITDKMKAAMVAEGLVPAEAAE